MDIIVPIIMGGMILILVSLGAFGRIRIGAWLRKPSEEGKFIDCRGRKIFYRVRGKGDPAVIIINTFGSSSMEWWSVQNDLDSHCRVITFERPGYGWSSASEGDAKASSVSDLIDSILRFERIKKPVILVTNGFASIYARHYACTRPQNVAGAVFINPVPVDYKHWLRSLAEFEEYKPPEKIAKKRLSLAKTGFYGIKSPFRRSFGTGKYGANLVQFYNAPSTYATMLKELSGLQDSLDELRNCDAFPHIPLKVIFSGEESLIREWARYGVPDYSARQICRQNRILSMDNLYLSPKSQLIEVEGGGELIHMGKPGGITTHVIGMVKSTHHLI
jgi:pimeloyl-ACP methyl ester carboxylesterase